MLKSSIQRHHQGGYSSLLMRAAGPSWPSVAGLCEEKHGFRTGWSKIMGPALPWSLREGRGFSHSHIVWLGPGLHEQRDRDRLSRQGKGGGLVGALVAGHRDLCPLVG